MNRAKYFDSIEYRLTMLGASIDARGGLNLLDYHVHSEDFYQQFLNKLFQWKLKNLNELQPNSPGLDLVDEDNKIVVQVSATATKTKVESALSKDLSEYTGYCFKFVSICKSAEHLRKCEFENPHGLVFAPSTDILDIGSLLAHIKGMDIGPLKEIYEFLKSELQEEPDPVRMESNLAEIITVLAREDLGIADPTPKALPYDIVAKISYNQLNAARALIDEYKIHHNRLDRIYTVFDKQGANKSRSILSRLRKEYVSLGDTGTPDDRFFRIIANTIARVQASANYPPIPDEELSLCVDIIVVDAFIRCKIFENPMGDPDAHS